VLRVVQRDAFDVKMVPRALQALLRLCVDADHQRAAGKVQSLVVFCFS
jgi:hypothetical protein